MDLGKVAKENKVSLSELEIGVEMEKEHFPGMADRVKIALDHLKEYSDYYTRLTEMEKTAEKAHEKPESPAEEKKEPKKKTEEEEADERVDKMWKSLKEEGPSLAMDSNPEPYYPTVSLEADSFAEYKVGQEVEIKFKACVESIRQSKDKSRVEFKLKEMAE